MAQGILGTMLREKRELSRKLSCGMRTKMGVGTEPGRKARGKCAKATDGRETQDGKIKNGGKTYENFGN